MPSASRRGCAANRALLLNPFVVRSRSNVLFETGQHACFDVGVFDVFDDDGLDFLNVAFYGRITHEQQIHEIRWAISQHLLRECAVELFEASVRHSKDPVSKCVVRGFPDLAIEWSRLLRTQNIIDYTFCLRIRVVGARYLSKALEPPGQTTRERNCT